MPHLTYQASPRTGLSDIAEEFRELDTLRRHQGLSMTDAERYHALFARLSDALASCERHRRVDARQFLRVQFDMALVLRTPQGEALAACHDFGGGGCAVSASEIFHLNDDVWLDGAVIEGIRHPLHGRAVVAWARLPTSLSPAQGYGLRFAIDSRDMRDQVDRVMYRVLDAFLHAPVAPRETTTGLRALVSH
jgi:PilZ domain